MLLDVMLRFDFPPRSLKDREDEIKALHVRLCRRIKHWHRVDGWRFFKDNPQQSPKDYRFKPYRELPFVCRFLHSRVLYVHDQRGPTLFTYEFRNGGIWRETRKAPSTNR